MSGNARPRHPQNRTTALACAAIAFGSIVVVAAPPAGADPNPFNSLSCNCPETAPPGSAARGDEIARGIRLGEMGSPAQKIPASR